MRIVKVLCRANNHHRKDVESEKVTLEVRVFEGDKVSHTLLTDVSVSTVAELVGKVLDKARTKD